MAGGDAGIPKDASLVPERNISREFTAASEVGNLVIQAAKERAAPQFGVRRYTMPMLDLGRFPQEMTSAIAPRESATEEDVANARRASISLAVEAAVQVVEAPPPAQVSEDARSLNLMLKVINRGRGLTIQIEGADPQAVINAGRGALERRKEARGLEDASSWDDKRVKAWTEDRLQKAAGRLGRSIAALDAYHSSF